MRGSVVRLERTLRKDHLPACLSSSRVRLSPLQRPGCFPPKKGAEKEEPGDGSGALKQPINGWGAGVAEGWQARSALRFNGEATKGFASSPPFLSKLGEEHLLCFERRGACKEVILFVALVHFASN